MDDQIARIAAKQMGVEPPAAPAPAPAPAPQPQAAAPRPAPRKDAPPTAQEQASKAGSPQTEGDRQNQTPMVYKVKIGDQERALTPQQIASTFERYRDLNYKHSQNAPINELAERMMKAGNATPDQVAKFLGAAAQAFTKNAQMGRATQQGQPGTAPSGQPSPRAPQPNLDEEFRKYEDENAIALPPGYREAANRMNRMEQQLNQSMGMMQQILQRSQQGAQQGAQAAQSAQQDRNATIRNTIANNLDSAQREAGLPDEDGQAFMRYAGERGYTVEDFADRNLTRRVINDFKNQKNTPEFQRLQQMAQRREAFLKSQSGGPATGQGGQARPRGDQTMARLTAGALNRRFNP